LTSTGRFSPFRRRLIPEGVPQSLWDYATSERLAEEETAYFADHPLCSVDLAWIASVLGPGPGLAADLGCGSGRASAILADLGWDVLAIDLSRPMLRTLQVEQDSLESTRRGTILPVQANIARLDFLPAGSLDASVCLFSTLGMLPERTVRRRCLAGISAALVPGGKLLLHAHNWWVQKASSQGRRWMLFDTFRRLSRAANFGNRSALYRGIPGVTIHCFTWNELAADLAIAGFRIVKVISLDAETSHDLGAGAFTRKFRAGAWLIEAQKTGQIHGERYDNET